MTIILDGNNVANRAHFGYPPQANKAGKDIHVSYGVLDTIRKMIKIIKTFQLESNTTPIHVIMVWDGGVPKFRREKYPTYKNKEKKSTGIEDREIIYEAIEYLHTKFLKMFGIPSIKFAGAEGDDLISILVKQISDLKIIVSSDMDFYQLLSGEVHILNPFKDTLTKYRDLDVTPEIFLLARLLAGDSSDNLPGIKGVGPVKSSSIIKEFHSIQNIINYVITGRATGHPLQKELESIASQCEYINNVFQVINLDYSVTIEGLWNYIWEFLTSSKPNRSQSEILKTFFYTEGWVQPLIGFNNWIEPLYQISQDFIPLSRVGV